MVSILVSEFASAQEESGSLELFGYVYKGEIQNRISSVKVTLVENGKEISRGVTKKGGKFAFDLEFQKEYVIKFSLAKHVNMFLEVSTVVDSKLLPLYREYRIDIPVIPENLTGVNLDAFNQMAFTRIAFNPGKAQFIQDPEHLERFYGLTKVADEVAEEKPVEKEDVDKKKPKKVKKDPILIPIKTPEEEVVEDTLLIEEPEPPIPDPEPVDLSTPDMEYARTERARAEEIKVNKEVKLDYEKTLKEVVQESNTKTTSAPVGEDGPGPTHAQEVKVAKHNKATKDQERAVEKRENTAKRHELKKTLLIAVAEDTRKRKLDSLENKGPTGSGSTIKPTVKQYTVEERFATIKFIELLYPGKKVVFKEVLYVWGSTAYYKDGEIIEKEQFSTEVNPWLGVN